MGQGKKWTQRELDILLDSWGSMTIQQIMKKLPGRNFNAVNIKAKRLHLRQQINGGELLSARYVSALMGVDIHTVTDYWVLKCGLKGRRKRVGQKGMKMLIKYSHLLKWLEKNQDKWDSRRVDKYGLGIEYKWLTAKREADALLPKNKNRLWTDVEDERLRNLFRLGNMTLQQIGEIMGRPRAGIAHRLTRIDVWGTKRKDAAAS